MTIRRSASPPVRKPRTISPTFFPVRSPFWLCWQDWPYDSTSFPPSRRGLRGRPFYIELAWNWLKKGIYGFPIGGILTPVDMRVPGYPAFLAAIFTFAGKSEHAVMLVQVFVDLATCSWWR